MQGKRGYKKQTDQEESMQKNLSVGGGGGGYRKQTDPDKSLQENWSRGRGVIKSKLVQKNLYRKTGPGGGGL